MSTKTVYLFDRLTSLYCGVYEAQESPEEPGEYILPTHCTEYPIPSLPEGEKAKWNGTYWEVIPAPPPPTPLTPEQLAAIEAAQAKAAQDAADAQAAREDAQLAAIAAMTPAQAAQWIENNVTNLAEAKNALKIMVKAICILARRI